MPAPGTGSAPALRLEDLPAIPRDAEGPLFREPWEAQAFAMAVALHESGHFTWTEWSETLAATIAAAPERGEPDLGERYYEHWLVALERLSAAKGLASSGELAVRKEQWDAAARATPHGAPIVLPTDDDPPIDR